MTATISFVDTLFARGMDLEKRGMLAEACRTYERLLHIRPLTRKMVGEAAGRLGKLQLERGRFAKARRHLALSVARLPGNAEYQNLLARAIEADETCDIEKARQPYMNCVDLQPNNPFYLVDLARYLVQCGQDQEAFDVFQKAFDAGAENPEVVAAVAEGLRDLGRSDEAQSLLRRAQFRHARHARFRQLWQDHQFQLLWARQQAARSTPAEIPILRFVRSA
jgi:Flp pilus assembly protein TadD